MPVVKILKHWPSAENYEVGEEYDISNVESLVAEGKVEIVDQPHDKGPEPVSEEPKEEKTPEASDVDVKEVTPGSAAEGQTEEPKTEEPLEPVE
jgi:hypothetical protein